ncbi:MAG: EAL domain-containing protein [Haliea sp.]|jgi:EAL domain-containing protein (putative c-di-GMP-specific phosphodiesterase class I)|nr:EAL domain-containing protein [Haliea sp.]
MNASRSVLGLVELSDSRNGGGYNSGASNVLRDVFQDRLRGWVRAKDQWRLLNNNRVCVILKDMTRGGELELAAAKLGRIFDEPHFHMGRALPLSVNAGFAEIKDCGRDISEAMEQATLALTQAKKSRRLFDVYSDDCTKGPRDERELISQLERALEMGELQLYYQPKVHAGYQSLLGAEALMRWHTPEKQVITPDRFIDVAERYDVIRPMTWWAIKTAVARLARWPTELSIAVNVSPKLLLENEILSVVQDALDIHGVAPKRLNLEVTESIMVDNQDTMLGQLARLREMGTRISIDDFGTGFSSLAYFRDLPVDEIKIDKSFVMHMLKSEKDLAIVKAVINLAHNFSLKVVAEGVEDQHIASALSELGCDVLQGYFFDKPLPVEQFNQNYRL